LYRANPTLQSDPPGGTSANNWPRFQAERATVLVPNPAWAGGAATDE
jgi:hypothetical protein